LDRAIGEFATWPADEALAWSFVQAGKRADYFHINPDRLERREVDIFSVLQII